MDKIKQWLDKVSAENIRGTLFYLAGNPLPFRKVNYTLPGHAKSTLDEADDFIAEKLEGWGYKVEREPVKAQAFWKDESKPKHAQYGTPRADDPWYTLYNIYGIKKGTKRPEECLVIISHKDSQSWVDSPGAYDNAAGTAATLELARALQDYKPQCTLYIIFCNEEHWPWTSIKAAQTVKERQKKVLAVINQDSPGRKRPDQEEAGIKAACIYYTTPEGEKLADMMGELNKKYKLGLEFSKFKHKTPMNDDGSFIKAGIGTAVHIGPMHSYRHPHYHTEEDKPEYVDVENLAGCCKLSLVMVLEVDNNI